MGLISNPMNTIINQRLEALRDVMRRERLDAFIFPSTDPHHGEYVPAHWEGRKWISGFDGSAGTAVVTLHSAALWTDSRYFIAAQEQLHDTEFVLMRERIAGTPTIAEWIADQLQDGEYREAGVDGMVFSVSDTEALMADLRRLGGITLRTNFDPLSVVWTDRPPVPLHPVNVYPMEYAGETTQSKLARIRRALRQQHADGMLVTALDDIAWTLNLRGSDVHCNPVFVSYLLISTQEAVLYIDPRKLTAEVRSYLAEQGVKVDDYAQVSRGLTDYFEYNILIDPDEVCYTLYKYVRREVVREASPVPSLKAVKNETEQRGFRNAMLRDGIAMTRFLCWLDTAVAQGGVTECSAAEQLRMLRAELPLYRGLSFDTIAAYQEHGAIVHYEPVPQTDIPLRPEGLLLVDSGAQYLDGTTDITRTIALGPLTDEQRRVYTLVLKGHIDLQLLRFPEGAAGTQLDAVARRPLWAEGLNYLHGTGHGVGAFLNVHEGPHQIRMEWRGEPLREGMTVTDEPGIYLEGRFGVRIENTLMVVPFTQTECGRFLQFETLTLCPIDLRPVIADLLSPEETRWLNAYHARVREALTPHLDTATAQWLAQATEPL